MDKKNREDDEMRPRDGANPNCEDCGGEGIIEYADGEDSFTDLCETCYGKGACIDDLNDNDEPWKDD